MSVGERRRRDRQVCGIVIALLVGVAALSGCGSGGDAITPSAAAPVTVRTGVAWPATAQLRDERFAAVTDGIASQVELLAKPRMYRDVDGDGHADTIGFLQTRVSLHTPGAPDQAENAGDTGTSFLSLAVLHTSGLGETTADVLPLSQGAAPRNLDVSPAKLSRGGHVKAHPAQIRATFTAPDSEHPETLRERQVVGEFSKDALTQVGAPTTKPEPVGTAPTTALALGPDKPSDPTPGAGTARHSGVAGYGGVTEYSIELPQRSRLRLDVTSGSKALTLGIWDEDGTVLLDPAAHKHSFDATIGAGTYRIAVSAGNAAPVRYDLAAVTAAVKPVSRKVPGRASTGKVLHLTFDDGPNPEFTGPILDLLAKYHAHATFFVVGQNAARHPGWTDRELAGGNAVANHSYTHRSLRNVSQQVFDDEVDKTQRVLGPRGSKCLRPPYGYVNDQLRERAADKGFSIALWDVDTKDWKRGPVPDIVHEVESHAETGNIILMHDGGGNRSHTVAALEIVLRDLTAQGWSFESICK
ncbi:MAG TPA: polysaccharide deacetylase family protein [Mycobacteriales bacterium]|jgi:peptidoglycan/xylan/chitin deacetylase (PgdA/CDA1 family)|nr:polysaccharide deacetylase family protein [Mycobacteriales bacterium]